MKNFALCMPQYFTTEFMNCKVLVSFENKEKWDQFKQLVEAGQYKQLFLEGKPMDYWVDNMNLTFVTGAKDLQEWFDDYCKPIGSYSYDSWSSNPSTADMFMSIITETNKAYKELLDNMESKIKKILKDQET